MTFVRDAPTGLLYLATTTRLNDETAIGAGEIVGMTHNSNTTLFVSVATASPADSRIVVLDVPCDGRAPTSAPSQAPTPAPTVSPSPAPTRSPSTAPTTLGGAFPGEVTRLCRAQSTSSHWASLMQVGLLSLAGSSDTNTYHGNNTTSMQPRLSHCFTRTYSTLELTTYIHAFAPNLGCFRVFLGPLSLLLAGSTHHGVITSSDAVSNSMQVNVGRPNPPL